MKAKFKPKIRTERVREIAKQLRSLQSEMRLIHREDKRQDRECSSFLLNCDAPDRDFERVSWMVEEALTRLSFLKLFGETPSEQRRREKKETGEAA